MKCPPFPAFPDDLSCVVPSHGRGRTTSSAVEVKRKKSMALEGYGRVRCSGAAGTFGIMIASFLIPFDAIAVPLFEIMRGFNLPNTYAGLILPGVGNGLAVLL